MSYRANRPAVAALLLIAIATTSTPAQAPAAASGHLADSSLAFLAPLIGDWAPVLPDSVARTLGFTPVAGNYEWIVGGRAIRYRERYRAGDDPDTADLQGMILWNPATETVEFIAVAGPGEGQGRLFRGEYRLLADGTIEREYHVYYRTMADIPGEELGGSRRRFRETVSFVTPDSVTTTLEWWHDGAWRPFGPFARGSQVRLSPGS